MDFINYKRKNYPLREIKLPEFGYVNISIETLRDVLLNEDCSYKTKEAQFLDEKIFFFIENDKINLPAKDLKKYFALQNL